MSNNNIDEIIRLKHLVKLQSSYLHPVILFIGRCSKELNAYKSILDDSRYMQSIGLKVLNVNILQSVYPDIVCDFSNYEERMKLQKYLESNNMYVVMIIFDASVFKFMKNIKELIIHIKQFLVQGGIFITDYCTRGGGIILSENVDDIEIKFTDITGISIPMMKYDQNPKIINDAIKQSQKIFFNELKNVFSNVSLIEKKFYPYVENYETTYFICENNKT